MSRLEDDGYLIRTIDESDRRATVLKLTEMGAVRAEEIRSEREEFLDEFFSKLSEDEKHFEYEHLKEFIRDAKENINRGYAIYYYSSW